MTLTGLKWYSKEIYSQFYSVRHKYHINPLNAELNPFCNPLVFFRSSPYSPR